MAKFSAATEYALSVVAHAAMARGLSKNVEGFAGFYEFWLKDQTSKDCEILDYFKNMSALARRDLADMIAKDVGKQNG